MDCCEGYCGQGRLRFFKCRDNPPHECPTDAAQEDRSDWSSSDPGTACVRRWRRCGGHQGRCSAPHLRSKPVGHCCSRADRDARNADEWLCVIVFQPALSRPGRQAGDSPAEEADSAQSYPSSSRHARSESFVSTMVLTLRSVPRTTVAPAIEVASAASKARAMSQPARGAARAEMKRGDADLRPKARGARSGGSEAA